MFTPDPRFLTQLEHQGFEMIDDQALSYFSAMGRDVTPKLEKIYTATKRMKDKIYPGRMSPEACAVIAMFADVMEQRIDFDEKPAPPAKPVAKKISGDMVIGE